MSMSEEGKGNRKNTSLSLSVIESCRQLPTRNFILDYITAATVTEHLHLAQSVVCACTYICILPVC